MSKQQQIEHILTPETEKHFFTDQILPPLLRGESVTVIRVPHSGIRTEMVFLTENSNLFGFKILGQCHFFYVGFNELIDNSPEGFFQLMNYTINPNGKTEDKNINSFFKLKGKIQNYLKNGAHIVFVFGEFNKLEFPPTFFNNLHSFWQMGREKVHFVFTTTKFIFDKDWLKKYDQLAELITQNIVYFPLLSETDSLFVAKHLCNQYRYLVSDADKRKAVELVGGHPALIRACLRVLNESKTLNAQEILNRLLDQWEVNIILEDIWLLLKQEERVFLSKKVSKAPVVNYLPKYLIKMNIVGNNYRLFSPLFEAFVKAQKDEKQSLSISEKNGHILINEMPLKEKITLHEYHLLVEFLKNTGTIVSRDQIAEALWGKDSYRKYSDWAIDQIISLLRKKLESLGVPSNSIETVKGMGYRWKG